MKLSVAIAIYNEENNLEACLSSVASMADEIVIVDGGSTDATVEIGRKFTSRIIKTDNPLLFHINKQKALDACTGDWILQLDADEVVTSQLREEILTIISPKLQTLNSKHFYDGYYISRKNYFWGHCMKKGGQYPDYVIRLVRNGKSRFPCKSVHEQIEVDGEVGYLINPLDHFAYRTREDYWKKAETYTTLTSIEMKKSNIPIGLTTWLTYVVIKPLRTFLSIFVIHKGFIDGWYGFIFAYWSALHHAIAYRKYRKSVQ